LIEQLPAAALSALREGRAQIAPFIGAGLSAAASSDSLVAAVSAQARGDGLDLAAGDLLSAAGELEGKLGLERTRELFAAAVRSRPARSTPTLEVLARCRSRVIATFNYDDSIERAILATGQVPRPLLPNTAEVFRDPAEGEVGVVHLHGSALEPETLVLPGRLTEALNEDDPFKGALRHLWLRHLVVYLGFRLGPAETHVRAALGWLVAGIRDVEPQLMLLPRSEFEARGEELEVLAANPFFSPVPYPDSPDHRAVHLVALVIAPRNEPTTDVLARRAPQPVPYFLPPPISIAGAALELAGEGPREVLASLGAQLARSRRIVLEGVGGMGKTQLLRALGASWDRAAQEPLYLALDRLPSILDQEEPLAIAFARFAAGAEGFREGAPRPSYERLETGRFAFLLDGFDELAPARRGAVAAALAEVAATFSQHVFILASRPALAEVQLTQGGFQLLRLEPSSEWGRRYLAHRGLAEEQIGAAIAMLGGAAGELLGVPMQCAYLGERIIAGEELPSRPIDFAAQMHRDLLAREAARRGWPAAALSSGLAKLAFALTFGDAEEASEGELGALSAIEVSPARLAAALLETGLMSETAHSRLAFPTRTQREALAASLVLESRDPAGLLARVAYLSVEGRPRPLPFLDALLDWVWESAPSAERERLFALDPQRSLRLHTAELSAEQLEFALDDLWRSHLARDRMLSSSGEGPRSSLAEALALLAERHPELIGAQREAWAAAAESGQASARANAIFLLAASERPGGETAPAWLRLEDPDREVRLEALEALCQLRRAGAAQLVWAALVRFPTDRYRFAIAMVEVAAAKELEWVADRALAVGASGELVERLLARIDLVTAVGALERIRRDSGAAALLAVGILGTWPVEHWSADLAERFFFALRWPPELVVPSEGFDEFLPGLAGAGVRDDRFAKLTQLFDSELERAKQRGATLDRGSVDAERSYAFQSSFAGRMRLRREGALGSGAGPADELAAEEDLELQQAALAALPRGLVEVAAIAEEYLG
jgi:hypothetical protein